MENFFGFLFLQQIFGIGHLLNWSTAFLILDSVDAYSLCNFPEKLLRISCPVLVNYFIRFSSCLRNSQFGFLPELIYADSFSLFSIFFWAWTTRRFRFQSTFSLVRDDRYAESLWLQAEDLRILLFCLWSIEILVTQLSGKTHLCTPPASFFFLFLMQTLICPILASTEKFWMTFLINHETVSCVFTNFLSLCVVFCRLYFDSFGWNGWLLQREFSFTSRIRESSPHGTAFSTVFQISP